MKKKLIFIPFLIAVFTLVLLTPGAQAGPEERYRWEGIAIGIGAAIVGGAILHSYNQGHPGGYVIRHEQVQVHRPRPAVRRHQDRRGHWEIRKEWVPSTYKKVWNPGHYNRRGEWIRGHWVEIVDRPGYYEEKRVWVCYR